MIQKKPKSHTELLKPGNAMNSQEKKVQKWKFQCSESIEPSELLFTSLREKYTKAEVNACHAMSLEKFISNDQQLFPGGYREFETCYSEKRQKIILSQYYPFRQIRSKVTDLIKIRVAKDKNYLVHFQCPYVAVVLRYVTLSQILNRNLNKGMAEDVRSTESEEGKTKQMRKNNIILPQNQQISSNQSTEQMKALASVIDKMCKKFKNKANFKAINELKIRNPNEKYFFKKISANFSRIQHRVQSQTKPSKKSEKSNERKKEKTKEKKKVLKDTQEIYGLDKNYADKKKKSLTRFQPFYGIRMSSTISSRGDTNVMESPISRAYYLKELLLTQKQESCQKQRKGSKKKKSKVKSLSKSKIPNSESSNNMQNSSSKKDLNRMKSSKVFKSEILK